MRIGSRPRQYTYVLTPPKQIDPSQPRSNTQDNFDLAASHHPPHSCSSTSTAHPPIHHTQDHRPDSSRSRDPFNPRLDSTRLDSSRASLVLEIYLDSHSNIYRLPYPIPPSFNLGTQLRQVLPHPRFLLGGWGGG